jgi:hypothetical protein
MEEQERNEAIANLCPTMWSTHDTAKNGDKINGRRHGCQFPKGHKGGICMCVCKGAHRNLDKKENADALV